MGTTLLLADDSITIQKVVGIIFANEDYELVVVDNGDSALEKARETKPDVMLVDALMPGKNGYEVCEEVRRDPVLKDMPLLLLVGAFEPFDEDKARKSGADDHITKPFESQSLIDKVKALVDLASSRAVEAPSVPEAPAEPEIVELPEPPAAEIPDVAFAAAVAGGEEPEPVEFPEIAAAEISEAVAAEIDAPEEPPVGAPATEAKLFDSFRDFLRLGGGAAESAESPTSVEKPSVEEPSVQDEPEGVVLLSTVDIVEASPEDDPWGTFSEVVEEGEAIRFGEILDTKEEESLEFADAVQEIEPFALLDEESPEGVISPILPPEEPDEADMADFLPDEEIAFAEISEPEEPIEEIVPPASPGGESISLGDFSPTGEFAAVSEAAPVSLTEDESTPDFVSAQETPESLGFPTDETALPFAAEEDYVSTGEESEPSVEPAAVTESPVGAEEAVTLTEEQLAAAISRVSRELIEKIAWEVVPDLAESIIKEEIRKIKEGLGR